MEPIKEDPYFSQAVETTSVDSLLGQWEFQDPKMEVLYHIRPYFVGIFPYIGLKNRPFFYGRYLQSIGSWPAWPLIIPLDAAVIFQGCWNMLKLPRRFDEVCRWNPLTHACKLFADEWWPSNMAQGSQTHVFFWSNVARWHASGERHIRFIPIRFCLASVGIFWSECGALPSVSWGHAARWWVLNILSI